MHPIIQAEIMKTRAAGARRRAGQARLAQAAGQGRSAPRPLRMPRVLPGRRPWRVAHRPAI